MEIGIGRRRGREILGMFVGMFEVRSVWPTAWRLVWFQRGLPVLPIAQVVVVRVTGLS